MIEFINDVEKRLIKTTVDPMIMFEEEPLMMFVAIRAVSESGFDLHGTIYNAILKKEGLLANVSTDSVREELEAVITAEYAGKGLKMLIGTGLIRHIVGTELAANMSKYAKSELVGLAENIDKTKRVRARRLGLFYLCFEKKEALEAIKMLNFDAETKGLLIDAATIFDKINFLANTFELKQFIVRHGIERYEYLHNLSKAKRIVYDLDDTKIKSRNFLMDYIEERGEPVFLEELDVDRYDIINNGIAGEEKVDEILSVLLELVHEYPQKNTKKILLAHAQKHANNPVSAVFQKMPRWLR